MKKSPAILILLLALLLQLRVAYGCAVPSELVGAGCDRHGLVAVTPGAPSDEEGGCHGGIELASRALRADDDRHDGVHAAGADAPGSAVLLDSQAQLLALRPSPHLAADTPAPGPAPAQAGARTYLVTARLRL